MVPEPNQGMAGGSGATGVMHLPGGTTAWHQKFRAKDPNPGVIILMLRETLWPRSRRQTYRYSRCFLSRLGVWNFGFLNGFFAP